MRLDNPQHTARGAAVTSVVLESFRLNAALLAVGEQLTREFGTTGARWTVLSELQLAGEPRTVPQIARALGLKRQGIQRLADALGRDGLVEFRPNPDHARAQRVALTPAGRALLERLDRRQAQWANRVGETLAPRELERAARGLAALRAMLDAPRAARSPPITRRADARRARSGSRARSSHPGDSR